MAKMAKVQYFDGNSGFYQYSQVRLYSPVSMSESLLRLEYGGADGVYDPTRHAFAVELVLENAEFHQIEVGPRAGERVYSSGTISRANFVDDTGRLLLSVTGIDADLPALLNMIEYNVSGIYHFWIGAKTLIVGSNDSSGPFSDWTGDDIATGKGRDVVRAMGGDDYIKDRGGADLYNGGAGYDTVSYDEYFWRPNDLVSGLRVDLQRGRITGPDGHVDKLKSIESVRGTFVKDVFLGDTRDNRFFGFQGRDEFDGRAGVDIVLYNRDTRYGGQDGIVANLAKGVVRDGFGSRDTVRNVEGVVGTDTDDVFHDDRQDNFFEGRDGDDTYWIGRGNDHVGDFGAGADTFRFVGNSFGYNHIEGFDQDRGERDQIFIEGVTGLGDLSISQAGDNTEIRANGGTVVLVDFQMADLTEADFIFDGAPFL